MEIACARNPWTGKGTAKEDKQKSQAAEKNKPPATSGNNSSAQQFKKVDISTLLLLTRSHEYQRARSAAFLETLDVLRPQCLSLSESILQFNSLTQLTDLRAFSNSIIAQMQAAQLSKKPTLQLSLLVDACLSRMAQLCTYDTTSTDSKTIVRLDPARLEDVACPLNIPDLHPLFLRVVVSRGVSTAGMPMAHIFWKILPCGSAARTTNNIIKDYASASPFLMSTVNKMMICSLVGNYEHSQTRLSINAREHVYTWFTSPATDQGFAGYVGRQQLLDDCPKVYVFALRDYLIHLLEDNPVLRRHFDVRYDYAVFKTITQEGIEWMREYIEKNIALPMGTMVNAPRVEKHAKLIKDLDKFFTKLHAKMLKFQTKPPAVPFFQFAGEIKGSAPVALDRIRHQILAHHKTTATMETEHLNVDHSQDIDDETDEQRRKREEAEQKKEDADIKAHLDLYQTNFTSMAALNKLIKAMELKNNGTTTTTTTKKKDKPMLDDHGIKLTKQGLTLAASKAMYALMGIRSQEIRDHNVALDHFLTNDISSFGALDPVGISEFRRIWAIYLEGKTPSTTLRQHVYRLSKGWPTTWSLIVAAWTARDTHQRTRLFALDYYTIRNQSNALCRRFSVGSIDKVPPTAFRLCVCMGCQSVKSWVKDPHEATSKETYSYGLKDVSVDLYTDQAFCRSNKSFMHFQCGVQEIMHIGMFGQALEFGGKVYMHCAQKSGGHIGIYDPNHMEFNELGSACYACTLELQKVKLSRAMKEHPYGPSHIHKCFMCPKRITKPANKYVYAKNTILCQKHHSNELLAHLHRVLTLDVMESFLTSESAETKIREAILSQRAKTREDWKPANRAKYDQLRKQARKNSWAKARR